MSFFAEFVRVLTRKQWSDQNIEVNIGFQRRRTLMIEAKAKKSF